MRARLPLFLTVLSLALAGPGTVLGEDSKDKDKDKDKDKKQDKAERKADKSDHGDDHDDDHDDRGGSGKVTICHVPPGNASARHTISVGESAWSAHKQHGDYRGACKDRDNGGGQGGAFDRLDTSNDGRISRREWPHGEESFNRLDRNDDGFLNREEFSHFGGETPRPPFEDLDRDRNNSISRGEWPFGKESFDRVDRNDDNMISRDEYRRGV